MESKQLEKKFHGIPWNFRSSKEPGSINKLHGIPCNTETHVTSSMEFHRTFLGHTGSSVEFHGTLKSSITNIKFHGIPWNSMQSAHLEKKFHGIWWNVSSSMKPGSITKFHGMSWLREYTLCLIFIIKSEVWTIFNFLGLGHETMVCTVCLSIFLMNSMSSPKPCIKFHVIPRNCEIFMELGVKRNSMEFYGILLPPNTMFLSTPE